MKLINKIIGLLFIAISLMLSSCWGDDEDKKKVVKIGIVLPQTGPVSEPGNNVLNGTMLAIEQFNKSNDDAVIELVIEDSKSNTKDGVSACSKLINKDKVKIIVGDIMSSVFLACAPIAEKSKVVSFSPGASSPAVREAGDYIFRNYLSDDFDGKVMANYLFNEQSINKVAILIVNNDYGIGVEKTFISEYQRLGGEVLLSAQYKQNENNFRSILSKLKKLDIDAVYMISNPLESGHIVKQMKELNIDKKMYGNLSFESKEFIKIAKGAFQEIIFSAPYFNLEANNEISKAFNYNFEKKYGKKPDVAAALGYDVALILIDVLKKETFDTSKIKNALYKVEDFNGITGRTTFDKKGDVLKDIYIKKINAQGNISIVKLFNIQE